MSGEQEVLRPVAWLKGKYLCPKQRGNYRSHHDDGRRGLGRHKASEAERRAIKATQPAVVMVIGPTGKRSFVRRARESAGGDPDA